MCVSVDEVKFRIPSSRRWKCCFTKYLKDMSVIGVVIVEKSVSVNEGESVALQTNFTEIQKQDKILWRFTGVNISLLVRMIEYKITYDGFNDVRFKDRLLISDTQSGDLTVKNMRIKYTGLYEAELRNDTGSYHSRFHVTVKESPRVLTTGEVKSVSVTEGKSVTLKADLTDIQRDAFILWRFGDESVLIAKCDKENNEISYSNDESFRDRLMLNDQNGDLTITNVSATHAGVYKLKISSNKQIIDKTFSVSLTGMTSGVIAGLCVFFLLVIAAVIAASVILYRRKISELKKQIEKSVSVFEEESVTLQTGVTKLQSDAVIQWIFGNNEVLAEINRKDNMFSTYDGADERFKDRLKLDNQTGDLTITNIMKDHSGHYKVKITGGVIPCSQFSMSKETSCCQYNVVVYVRKAEGSFVTLPTGINNIQTDDVIEWMHGDKEVIAEVKKKDNMFSKYGGADERFKDRLELNHQTGSLTISDLNPKHSGHYTLKITSSKGTSSSQFCIVVIEKIRLVGLGRSVTLDTGVTKIQKDDEIQWRFGPEDTVIAQITGGTDKPSYNFTDGRFSGLMQMNKQTGSLTISNITVKHSGVYKLQICCGKKTDYKKYNVFILVPAKDGESVTLKTEGKIQRGDQVEWSLKGDQLKLSKTDEITLVTGENGDESKTSYTDNWMHKDRLKMNAQTGDLNITDVKKSDAGFYTLQLTDTDGKISYVKFSLYIFAKSGGNNPTQQVSGVSGNEATMVQMPLLK
ncbi:uncharacterized protein [Misgurnus anguillicaudatus]|uniref:uncharacterized protein n=1 Tax=Misgurnus anguillicaudatus TaxID=75329 RepID=UPI003CCFBF1F